MSLTSLSAIRLLTPALAALAVLAAVARICAARETKTTKTFIDYFWPSPIVGSLTTNIWGAATVGPRDPNNGLADATMNRWKNGHVAAMILAVIDVETEQQHGNDGHGSKVIVIPFAGAALDRDQQPAANSPKQ